MKKFLIAFSALYLAYSIYNLIAFCYGYLVPDKSLIVFSFLFVILYWVDKLLDSINYKNESEENKNG